MRSKTALSAASFDSAATAVTAVADKGSTGASGARAQLTTKMLIATAAADDMN
jgi:hypothetical protein